MDDVKQLVHVTDDEPGYSRRKCGKGFCYKDTKNNKITNQKTLDRIKQLVIPPMWKKVWICPKPNGYLQATGYDAKDRKQYIYHPLWTEHRQSAKFNNLLNFGMHLSAIRATVKKDLRKKGWPKEKVLALAIMLMDEYFLRVGNEQYRLANGTYGLTTLRRKHILENEGKLELSYSSKSGKHRKISIENKRLVKLIKQTSELPGYEVFRYLENGQSRKIDSQDVNEYLQEITGIEFSAKNFRTWGGTLLAVSNYEQAVESCKENPKLHFETCIVKKVAEGLGNTVAVCREYYIHPRVLEVLKKQQLAKYQEKALPPALAVENLSENEQLILRILYKFCKKKPRILKPEPKDSVAA